MFNEIKKKITETDGDGRLVARCFYLISRSENEEALCNKILMKANRKGALAGQVNCRFCRAQYEALDGALVMTREGRIKNVRSNKHSRKRVKL